jgi:hypothetical protein
LPSSRNGCSRRAGFQPLRRRRAPAAAEQALHQIDRLTAEWEALTGRLAEIDEALLERHLRDRLAARLGSTAASYS